MNQESRVSNDRRHVVFSLKLSAVLIGASLLLTWARHEGMISKDSVERGIGVLTGLVFAAYGNALPKLIGPAVGTIGEARVAQGLRRFSGWALTVAFLVYAALWAFASRDAAHVGSIAAVAVSGAAVMGYAGWKYLTQRKTEKRETP